MYANSKAANVFCRIFGREEEGALCNEAGNGALPVDRLFSPVARFVSQTTGMYAVQATVLSAAVVRAQRVRLRGPWWERASLSRAGRGVVEPRRDASRRCWCALSMTAPAWMLLRSFPSFGLT